MNDIGGKNQVNRVGVTFLFDVTVDVVDDCEYNPKFSLSQLRVKAAIFSALLLDF